MELLAFGKTGWGDELFFATLMTIAVSITAMIIGFFFALIFTPLKLSKHKSLNLIGNFYPPKLIVIDTNFLKSLPNKDIRSGIGEMLHFYLVSSLKDYNFFKEHLSSVNGDLESINILSNGIQMFRLKMS